MSSMERTKTHKKTDQNAYTTYMYKKCNHIKTSCRCVCQWNDLPWVIICLIESYLPASAIVHLSCTSHAIYNRWTALRWKRTFQLHHRVRTCTFKNSKVGDSKSCSKDINRWEMYHVDHFGEWEKSFVGCCSGSDHEWGNLDMVGQETQFNLNSLVPSLPKAYGKLWGLIELSFLGLHDVTPAPDQEDRISWAFARMNSSEANAWNFVTTGLSAASKVVHLLSKPFLELLISLFIGIGKQKEKQVFPTDYARRIRRVDVNSICAWKLASLLKENGVDCFQCRICDKIDVKDLKDDAWMAPCRCNGFVHRQCLEDKLGLIQKLYLLEMLKGFGGDPRNGNCFGSLTRTRTRTRTRRHGHFERNEIAPQIWVSYDLTNANEFHRTRDGAITSPISVNALNQFISPDAKCCNCGEVYERTVRLPRSISEVVLSSLSDPLALARALSTVAYFTICIFIIASIEEGRCVHGYYENDIGLINTWTLFRWPNRTWKGIALAWWQLQQSCMLHILFSPRFAAVVEQLWMHSIYAFYIRLYFYFVITSIVLAASYFPPASRFVNRSIGMRIFSGETNALLSPVWDFIAAGTLLHYAISSTTVIAIFWRTNYRMYTVANRAETNDEISRQRLLQAQRNNVRHHHGPARRRMANWNEHPIYHGQWR